MTDARSKLTQNRPTKIYTKTTKTRNGTLGYVTTKKCEDETLS